jgi:hypothetical protein
LWYRCIVLLGILSFHFVISLSIDL